MSTIDLDFPRWGLATDVDAVPTVYRPERWKGFTRIPAFAHQVTSGRYRLTRPQYKDGTPRNYFVILQSLADGPKSKIDMLLYADYGRDAYKRGYLTALFSVFTACDLIRYDRKTNTYSYGDAYPAWYRKYVK